MGGEERKGGRENKGEEAVLTRVVIWTAGEGVGGLVGICVSAYMPGGLFTLAATVTAGASQWINLGLLNKYSLQ